MNHMDRLRRLCAQQIRTAFERLDRLRRRQGELLESSGLGPLEAPYRIIHAEPGLRVRRYLDDAAPDSPMLLIVPAPIKRPYIWDLAPAISVVRRCLENGMRVCMAEWMPSGDAEGGADEGAGLADYGSRLLEACFDAIERDSGDTGAVLAAHSLGGVFAAIFSCSHPRRVRALVLLESPLHFGTDAGDFAPLVAAAPDTQPIGRALASVPGSLLSLAAGAAAPRAFQWERGIDWSLSIMHPATLDTCARVERWTYDESPLPGTLFADVVELLYRQDRLMAGTLYMDGRCLGPKNLRAPLLNVVDPRSTVIPPASILPFHEAAASEVKRILRYDGDIGVGLQHVGVLVGSRAHAQLWPAIFDWLAAIGIKPANRRATPAAVRAPSAAA
ncbi:MAG TPA: alpha/beta fold hydrolase [Paucimonas sp.]|nr:alpha/beta fold hydrolase [Paucimonas sp.]